MMKRGMTFLIVASFLTFSTMAMAASDKVLGCDEKAARDVKSMMSQMGESSFKDGKVIFRWGSDWDHATPAQRIGLTKAFADSDACLTGKPREIIFFRLGKRVGEASPTTGVSLK